MRSIVLYGRALLTSLQNNMEQIGKGVLTMKKMIHTVKSGDTLWKIAHHHHTSIHHLLHMNPAIINPDLIYIGQRLRIH